MKTTTSSCVAFALAAVLLSSCSADVPGDDSNAGDETLEVITWWNKGGELGALDALIDVFNRAEPGVQVIPGNEGEPGEVRTRMRDRILSGDPPDTFHAISGSDIM